MHQLATSAHQQVMTKVDACYRLAEAYCQRSFPRPEITFNLRGKSAGAAHMHLNKIRFNNVLLQENLEAFLNQVVAHEICHLLAFQLYGRVRPHGREWQALMVNIFQLSPDVTHNLNTQSVSGRVFDYNCHCGLVKLSLRRHNRVTRGQAEYRCRQCQQILRPQQPVQSTVLTQ